MKFIKQLIPSAIINSIEFFDISGYEDLYAISKCGKIWSHPKKHRGLSVTGNKILTPVNCKGYKRINLTNNGVTKNYYVHRLIAFAFIPNPCNKPYINHKDGVKSNNEINNLEWCTQKENVKHCINITEKFHYYEPKKGKENSQSMPITIEYPNGKFIKYNSLGEFSRLTGFSKFSISSARRKGLKSHKFTQKQMKGITVHFEN